MRDYGNCRLGTGPTLYLLYLKYLDISGPFLPYLKAIPIHKFKFHKFGTNSLFLLLIPFLRLSSTYIFIIYFTVPLKCKLTDNYQRDLKEWKE